MAGMDRTDIDHCEPPSPDSAEESCAHARGSILDQRRAANGAARPQPASASHYTGGFVASGPLDRASFAGAIASGAAFFMLASASFALARFDTAVTSIWLANAAAVAFLLRARLSSELPFYIAAFAASWFANWLAGYDWSVSAVHSLANMINIAVVTWLTRTTCGPHPDMSELGTLARFVIAGGLLGPVMAAAIAACAMGPDQAAIGQGASHWFLTGSLGMVIIVPLALLICDAVVNWRDIAPGAIPEKAGLLLAGALCLYLVFDQSAYPLLFLILPLTLLHAFRLGSLGTAIHVTLVAAIAIMMTWAGKGPIVEASASREVQMHLIQAFVAANFLTGLPFAAILAGRDRMLNQLEAGKQSLDLLASNISDAVLRYDLADRCTYASPSVAEVLGEPASVYLGKGMLERTHQDAHDRIKEAKARLLAGESQKERFTYRRLLDSAAGTPVFIEAECALERDPASGHERGLVVSARDVTERIELELLLTRARRKAENAASAKTEFLANMSHEIRTPMNGVLGFAELMLQGELDREQRRNAEMIVQSGRSMMLLLNDILDLSKAEAGQLAIDHAPVDLHATLAECVALHRPAAHEKGLQIELAAADENLADEPGAGGFGSPPEVRPHVLTDGLRLRQIVLNLIGNAIKFTQSGQIRVTYRACADETRIRVGDTGIGISAARLETIFLPFTQEESSTTRRYGGTGLGLSISRQLAQLLGGELEVESTPGIGSVFTLRVPTTLVGASEAGFASDDAREPEAAEPMDRPAPARILLAEDHDVNRLLAAEMLKRCGQSVAIAHDGNEAISMVIDSMMRERPFDLVLMDVQMPGCDGYSATRAIREEGIGPDQLPIIALTANAFPEDVIAARASGMQAHLAKPIRFADLARTLQRWLPTQIVETPMDRDVPPAPSESEWDDAAHAGPAIGEDPETSAPRTAEMLEHQGLRNKTEAKQGPATHALQSPVLKQRWQARRSEAIAAVQAARAGDVFAALASAPLRSKSTGSEKQAETDLAALSDQALPGSAARGDTGSGGPRQCERARLVHLVHKLAGTAAIFGEAELGECAGELERALRRGSGRADLEGLADELLRIAASPAKSPVDN